MTQERIQRKRAKGWKMPPNTVYVGRPTKWGNPYRSADGTESVIEYAYFLSSPESAGLRRSARAELKGKNLACWCPLNKPCHADILLRTANEEDKTNDTGTAERDYS